jgi:site-specific recombinase XerD
LLNINLGDSVALAAVRDLRPTRTLVTPDEVDDFEQDLLAGFVLARASAGLTDLTISHDTSTLITVREWFGRPWWELTAPDMDRYFGHHMRGKAVSTRAAHAQSVSTFFQYLELRHKVEIHQATGHVVECPLDEINRPRGRGRLNLRVPPTTAEVRRLFTGWRADLLDARKFAVCARNYTGCRLMAQVGLRINELRMLDLDDVKWELGTFGKLHVRFGKGSHGRGPKQRMVPLINGGRDLLTWYVEEVRGLFDDDWQRPGAPLFPSERRGARPAADSLRNTLKATTKEHLGPWTEEMTPHVLRHFCASQLYTDGMDLLAIQELLGHEWVATTMGYVHVHKTHIEDAWQRAAQRATTRLGGW